MFNEGGESRNNHRYAVVVPVLATQWNPCQTKTSQETEKASRKIQKPSQKPKVIHTYILLEFGKYCEELSWNHITTTLHRSETSGIAEWAVYVEEKKRHQPYYCNLERMIDSMKRCCYLRDDRNFLADGKSQIWTKIRGILLGHSLFAGWNLGRRCSDCWDWKVGCIRNVSQKTEWERSPDNPKRWRFCISCGRWFSKIIRKRLHIPRTHSETGIHREERESQRRISWR